jgi:PAS domain S-box-containing protein
MASRDKIIQVRPARSEAIGVHGIAPGEIAILDAVDLPIVLISGDFRVARLNSAAKSLLGLSDSDIGRSPVKLFDLVKNLDLLCAQVMRDGAPCRREIRDGNRRFALRIAPYTGRDRQIVGAVLTFTNITLFRASIDQAVHEREYTKAILNTVSNPLVVLDAKLRVQTANRAFYTMFGVSRDETQGISIRELGDNVWQSYEVWGSIETSLSGQSEFRAVEIDREFPSIGRRTLALDPRRLELDGDAMVLLAFQDITERKQAERTTSLVAAIVDSSDDAIISKKLDGTIMTWNKGAERVFGYTPEEAIGKHITLIVPWERRSEEEEILRRLARGERVDHIETVRVRKDGTAVDISLTISPVKDAEGRVLGASKVARDITERKRTERALAKQARLLDLTTDAIFVRDSADRITYWNRAATELYGYTREEAMGRVTHELLQTKFPTPLESINEQLHRDDRWAGELVHIRKDGQQIVVASGWVLDRTPNGNPWSILETNTDVTDLKKAEKVLKESELSARLLQIQDEERRRIARELHDGVGQLLVAMSMNAARLNQEKSRLSSDAARCAEENYELIGQASKDIRTVSYLLHPPLLDEIGLHSALSWYIKGFAERSKIAATLDLAADLGRLPKDHELCLFRIAQESLTNVHRHSGSSTVVVRLCRTPNEIRMEVKDEGCGLKLDAAGNHPSGVGLHGMQERLKQLGGSLEIHSDGKGTTVTARLPNRESPDTAITREDAAEPSRPHSSK